MGFKKLTNESLWGTDQISGTLKEELYWAVEALKGMSGKENTESHHILSIADWMVCLNREGRVNLPYTVEGLLFRPGNPPANFKENKAEGTCLIIGCRVKKENEA